MAFNAEGGDTSESETYCTTTTTTTTTVREDNLISVLSLLNEQHSMYTTTTHFLMTMVSLGHHNYNVNNGKMNDPFFFHMLSRRRSLSTRRLILNRLLALFDSAASQ
jgi:hypothetical protein